MFGRKKNKKVKVEIQTNLGEFKELIREAESLLDQLQNQTNLYKRYHRKLKSLSAKTDNKLKEINNFKFKAKVNAIKKSDE